jgi:XTP/dITP diphosphohydrolase
MICQERSLNGSCHIFLGEVKGTISSEVCGQSGFGWDSIFISEGYKKSVAEMTAEEENAISMRKLALLRLKEFFGDNK